MNVRCKTVIAIMITMTATLVLGASPAMACSVSEDLIEDPLEWVHTVIEWESVDVGWFDGERASAMVPVRYWGTKPDIEMPPRIWRDANLRRSRAGECSFHSDNFVSLGQTARTQRPNGSHDSNELSVLDGYFGEPQLLPTFPDGAIAAVSDKLAASRYQSTQFWIVYWKYPVGLAAPALTVILGRRRSTAVSSEPILDDKTGRL